MTTEEMAAWEREAIPVYQREIQKWRKQFHSGEEMDISESVLDSLKHRLYEMEQNHPDLITPDSPTQTVL